MVMASFCSSCSMRGLTRSFCSYISSTVIVLIPELLPSRFFWSFCINLDLRDLDLSFFGAAKLSTDVF